MVIYMPLIWTAQHIFSSCNSTESPSQYNLSWLKALHVWEKIHGVYILMHRIQASYINAPDVQEQ